MEPEFDNVSRPEPVVECRSLVRVFESATGRVQAVRGVDLRIGAGRAVAVVGPSGSGKSSLLRMIGGLDEPSAGDVYIDGVNLARLSRGARCRVRARLLAHVHQRPIDNLLAHLTAVDQVVRVASMRHVGQMQAYEMLQKLGLSERANHFPHELSGGEQQRLAFARAAVGNPVLIIADEPTAELDTASSERVLDAVVDLVADDITVLLATHDPRVLERADEVITLRDGSVSSVTVDGSELAVIDQIGRLQLPTEVQDYFPEHRARLTWDPTTRQMIVERP